jgi:FkbM family methyltransferase
MRDVEGWWVPDGDTHLEGYLKANRGGYQRPHRLVSLAQCGRRRVALDVGAHIGLWSKDLAIEFGQVLAFEPVATFRECFVKNVPAANVVLHPFALGKRASRARIKPEIENSGATHIVETSDDGVEVRPLDSLELPVVDYVKIDVEGFELFVLEGAKETLLRCRPVITLEQKSHSARHFGVAQYAALEYLGALGAKVLQRVLDDWVVGWPERTR